MSIWNDKWVCTVGITDGPIEGANYYFKTIKEAEEFRRSIATEKDVEWCNVRKNPDSLDEAD